ncbi:MAG: flavodoxin domain-containing protein [Candidatus Neomarinimicrobiota bacterium]|jgi:menaquinone-dependent protoporphyrinogen IX oxidase
MSSFVIYCSKYGSTKTYAEKLAKDLNWEALSYKGFPKNDLMNCDSLVLASNIRMGKMGIRKWARSNSSLILPKCKAILAVGGTESKNQDYYYDAVEKNLAFLKLKKEQIIGLGGRQFVSEYKGFDAFVFKLMAKMIKDSKLKEQILKDKDHMDLKLLDPIIKLLKNEEDHA